MADTHLWALAPSGTNWAVSGNKAFNLWVWNGSSWVAVKKQWIWDGGGWALGFDNTPGPLVAITVSPSSTDLTFGDEEFFVAHGRDADGRAVSITPTWTVTTFTDSIDSDGTFHAGSTPSSGTVTATVGAIDGTAEYTVSAP